MMMIFATHKSERLLYVLQFIFEEFAVIEYNVTQWEEHYISYSGAKINYSHKALCDDEIHIVPSLFLNDTKHTAFTPPLNRNEEIPVLFPSSKTNNNNWHFDIFSAVFYMLSRYEEYNHKSTDKWGRFPAKKSLASINNFLHLPVVDAWLMQLFEAIQQKHKQVLIHRKTIVRFTYDVDVAYAYKGRRLARIAGAALKDVIRINPYNLAQRTAVLAGYLEDPFDTYDYIRKESINPAFFFLLSKQKTRYDHNLNPESVLMKQLIKEVEAWCPVGIHPSFYSSVKTEKISAEKQIMEAATGYAITKSRQHYLKFTMPHTYRALLQYGIREDYSMAFAETPGFRAGTCTPFYFFDVEKNKATSLKVYPACIMESTFRDDIILPAKKALPYFTQYFDAVNKVNGTFISIWHNDTLAANNKQHFRWLHQQILQYIRNHTKDIG